MVVVCGLRYQGTMFNIPVAIKRIHAAGSVMLPNTKLSGEFWRELGGVAPAFRQSMLNGLIFFALLENYQC